MLQGFWRLGFRLYLDPGCPSFLGVMSYKFVGYTRKKVGRPGSRWGRRQDFGSVKNLFRTPNSPQAVLFNILSWVLVE